MSGTELQPTPRLRFVMREVRTNVSPSMVTVQMQRILQQWCEWATGVGMWVDVPLEEET